MGERSSWETSTHDWAQDLDLGHLDQVRERASELAVGGVRHLILEVLAYADDEAEALGRKGAASVVLAPDGGVTVRDDGRGTDTRRDEAGRVIRKPVMATRDVRFYDAACPPVLPDGLPRRGISTVAALSTHLVHENHRVDGAWSQAYRHGIPQDELVPVAATSGTGTTVRFHPDPELVARNALQTPDLTGFRWLTVHVREGD